MKRAREILIVDDDEAIGRVLDLLLGDHDGWRVRRCRSAFEALRELTVQPPDLMILDMHLPDMDGLALYAETQKMGYNGTALALTGTSSSEPLFGRLLAVFGEECIVSKPFDIDDVEARIEGLLRSQ